MPLIEGRFSAMENHAAYLGHWIELLSESPRVLFQVLGDARKTVDLIAPEPEPETTEPGW
jgi:antirestriction protein ArdC